MCGAAIGCCGIAFWFLTFHFQVFSEKPSLNKNLLCSFWLIRVLWVLLQEYHGRLPIYHFDAYRLRNVADWYDLGGHEFTEGPGVCLIEWADRVKAALPVEQLRLTLTITGPTKRQATLEPLGARWEELVRRLDEEA